MRSRVIAAFFVLFPVVALHGTVLVPADLNELTAVSRAIVYARITEVRTLESDDRLRVETLVTAEAIGYVKGNLGRTISFRIPGGTVGAYKTFMVGAPSFETGEEVILFVDTDASSLPHLVGFSQGVFRVRMDDRTGVRIVVPSPAFATETGGPLKRGTRAPMPLDEFARKVRALADAAPRGRR